MIVMCILKILSPLLEHKKDSASHNQQQDEADDWANHNPNQTWISCNKKNKQTQIRNYFLNQSCSKQHRYQRSCKQLPNLNY